MREIWRLALARYGIWPTWLVVLSSLKPTDPDWPVHPSLSDTESIVRLRSKRIYIYLPQERSSSPLFLGGTEGTGISRCTLKFGPVNFTPHSWQWGALIILRQRYISGLLLVAISFYEWVHTAATGNSSSQLVLSLQLCYNIASGMAVLPQPKLCVATEVWIYLMPSRYWTHSDDGCFSALPVYYSSLFVTLVLLSS